MRYRQTGKAKRRYDLREKDIERTQEGPTAFHVRGYSKPLRDPTHALPGFSALVQAAAQAQMAAVYGVPKNYHEAAGVGLPTAMKEKQP